MNDLTVLTPEKVVVSYQQARLGSRFAAAIVDHILVIVILVALNMALSPLAAITTLAFALQMLSLVFGYFIYFIAFEGFWNGMTPGKASARIRVRMADGTPVTFPAVIYRALLRAVDVIFPFGFLTGALSIYFTEKAQRLGDIISGTVVVSEKPTPIPASPSPHMYGVHPLEGHVGDLRGMTRADYLMLKQLADRFPTFSEPVRTNLLREVWEPWATRHNMPNIQGVHPLYLIEAVVMKYGRTRELL